MAKQTVSRTALGAAICRMIEQYQPEKTRLFDDPVAKELVGSLLKFLMQFAGMRNLTIQQTDAVAKGIYGVQVCRTRYIDDVVQMDVVAKQSPWIFGLEPSGIHDFLKPYCLTLLADVGNADYQEKYLRPVERNLVVFEGERIAQATVS